MRNKQGAGAAATNNDESLVDYSKVTKKSLLVERVIQLQKNLSEKREHLERENALKTEFQASIAHFEINAAQKSEE